MAGGLLRFVAAELAGEDDPEGEQSGENGGGGDGG